MYKILYIVIICCIYCSCNIWEEGERYQQGFDKAIDGEYEEAAAIFNELAKTDTFITSINTYLKVLHDAQNQKINEETAKKLFQAFMIGRVSSDTVKLNYIKSAIQSDPGYSISYKELGNVHYYRKEFDQAILNYKYALQLDSTYYDLYYNLAICYDESGLGKEALFYYKKYVSLNPSVNSRYIQYANLRIMTLESFSF
jgi:tetratricopeptide (TPR) repeat protein